MDALSLVMHSLLKFIGTEAFCGRALESFRMHDGVEVVSEGCFREFHNLTDFIFGPQSSVPDIMCRVIESTCLKEFRCPPSLVSPRITSLGSECRLIPNSHFRFHGP